MLFFFPACPIFNTKIEASFENQTELTDQQVDRTLHMRLVSVPVVNFYKLFPAESFPHSGNFAAEMF